MIKIKNDKNKTSVTQFKNQFKIKEKLYAINIIGYHCKVADVKIHVIRKCKYNIQRKIGENEVKLA